MYNKLKLYVPPALWLLLFLLSVYRFEWIAQWLSFLGPSKGALRARAPLSFYVFQHVRLVLISTFFSMVLGITLGLLTRFRPFREFKEPLLQTATFLQTLPSIAILALSVPLLGYGQAPVVIALVFYGLLPILRNIIQGLDSVPEEVRLSAAGMGMTPWQRLIDVEWPLALPAVLAGIKTSVIINVSAATIGATMGAGGLGVLIVNGIRTMDIMLIIKGALPVSLMAFLINSIFTLLEEQWFGNRDGVRL
ncbi:MAG: ABC transporter permease [Clostridiales bacterium]|nr:ABC transporter permease [Clostridiales bacterium]